jgi:methylase of polypeptide subunit release factors
MGVVNLSIIRYVSSGDAASVAHGHKPRTSRDRHNVPGSSYDSLDYDIGPARKLIVKHKRLRYPYVCKFGIAVLEINDGVFCPTLAKASRLLLDAVTFKPNERVLDVFSGSGAFGINAALAGATVVTVDVSPLAVACTERNAILNEVGERLEPRLGTMTECIMPDEKFDVVLANPPLLPGDQPGELSVSIFDPGLCATVEFIRTVRRHLAPNGRCYLVTSDVIERYGHDVEKLSFESGLESYITAKLDVGYETYRVHEMVLSRTRTE